MQLNTKSPLISIVAWIGFSKPDHFFVIIFYKFIVNRQYFVIGLKNIFKNWLKVFMPDGSFRVSMDLICLFFIMYELLQIPLLLSFPEIENDYTTITSNIINFYFIADILLSFNTAFYRRGHIVKLRKAIAKHYMSRWFILGKIIHFLIIFLQKNRFN